MLLSGWNIKKAHRAKKEVWKLKEQLQAFNREAVVLEGRRNQIFFPISRDETIEKFEKFSGKSFSEVLLCVDEEHPHFKTSKNIILCLNQARECENLPDRQFSIFVKEYVEQLLDIIYKIYKKKVNFLQIQDMLI